jgi:replication-associated recombination protein RarA
MQLYRKHAPRSFDEVVGQDKAVTNLLRIRDNGGFGGRAYWIIGASGTGKTSIANLIARSMASDTDIEEFDSFGVTASRVSDMERSLSFRSLFGVGGRVAILNEAHGLRKDGIRQLLLTLERIPPHVAWIFTTSRAGNDLLFDDYDDAAPLVSRCIKVELTSQGLCGPFAKLAKRIAEQEGHDAPLSKFESLVKECKNNMRAVLSAIESGRIAA